MKNIENKIRKLRENKGYTQSFMAKKLGLSIRAYSKIERGETQLTINRLNDICTILDSSLVDLLTKEMFDKNIQNKDTSNLSASDVISSKQHYEETIAILKDQIETLKAIIEKIKF